jgi:MFS family permease
VPWWKHIAVDVSAFKQSRDYRILFIAGGVSLLGSMFTFVTLPFQIAELTGSYIAVGIIGAIELVALVVFGFWGGAIADSYNRKLIIIYSEIGLALCSLVLLVNALSASPNLWVLYGVAFVFSALEGIQRPSIHSLLPQLVPTHLLPSATALNSLRWNTGSIVGPALGGIFAAGIGAYFCYAIDFASYALSLILLLRLSARAAEHARQEINLTFIFSGFNYAKKRPDLLGTYFVDISAMIFAFPNALFPFMAAEYNATWAVGFLYAAGSVGSLIATATSGWVSRVNYRGRAIILAATCWGIAISCAGLASSIHLAIVFIAIAGASDMLSGLFRTLVWNTTIPLEMRGRLAGIEMLSYSVGPQLGQIRSTTFAQLMGLRTSLITGGALCVATSSSIGYAIKELWNFDDRTNPYAIQERIARHEENS